MKKEKSEVGKKKLNKVKNIQKKPKSKQNNKTFDPKKKKKTSLFS